jgi:hypothetical protein
MTQESIIGFLELTSVVIAGGLGIAGTITETKNKKGKLTKWGIVALAGIILSNSFSFIQTYLQREKEAQEQIASAESERTKATEANIRYKEQIDRLTAIVAKSDSSLKQQLSIQNQTSDVLTQVGQSVDIQNKIFKQSEVLNSQQKQTAENIGRTLNPLLPFKINFTLIVKEDTNSVRLIVISKLLQEKIEEIRKKIGLISNVTEMNNDKIEYLNKEGILPSSLDKKFYLLKPEYRYYDDLMKLFTYLSISMKFSKNYKTTSKVINCEVAKEYLKDKNNFKDAQLIYNPETASYYFVFENLPVHVTSDLQIGSYSVQDLEGSVFNLVVADSPGFVQQSDIVFKFPPDFSRINYIKKKGLGQNTLSVYNYYTYSYKTDASFYF